MTSRNTILKNSIDGFLARRGMSRGRFGLETAGNLSLPFIPSCLPTTARLSGTDTILSQWLL